MTPFLRRSASGLRAALAVASLALVACTSGDTTVVPAADDAGADTLVSSGDSSSDTNVGDSIASPDAAGDAPGGDATGSDASDASTDGAPAPTCTDPTTFPTFGKGCTLDSNCSFGLHQLDCCGSLGAIGINHAFVDDFNAAEDAYRKTCSVCDCLPKDTRTESGITTNDNSKIAVRCDAGLCKTYVK